MRGKLIGGKIALAAAISHRTSSSADEGDADQRACSRSRPVLAGGLPGGAADGRCRIARTMSVTRPPGS